MARYNRADRIGDQLHQLLAELIRREIKDPRVGPLTITDVSVSPDMGVAQVRFLPLGDRGDSENILSGLVAARGFLRRKIGKALRIRQIPELRFEIDSSHDEAFRIISALNELGGEE